MKHWVLFGLMLVPVVTGICVSAQQADVSAAPPGPGRDLIERSCVSCHDIYMIVATRRTRRDWADVVNRMADRGAEVSPQELRTIEEYLVANFSLPGGDSAPRASGSR